jgi:segregation and condensation protein B
VETRDLSRIVEAILIAADAPVGLDRVAEIVPEADRARIREAVAALAEEYEREGRAFTVTEVGGGWQLYCRPEYADRVREFQKGRIPAKLSQAALETLAIVAYKQPIVRTEIEAVRGVDSSGVLATLLKRDLVTIAGRAPGMGRALMYRTTREFLRYFGLNAITDLPRLHEFAEVLGLRPEELEATLAASESLAAFGGEAEGGAEGDGAERDDEDRGPGSEPEEDLGDAGETGPDPAHSAATGEGHSVSDLAIIGAPDEA